MNKIKILGLFVIFLVALSIVSTTRTYAVRSCSPDEAATALITCNHNLEVVKCDVSDPGAISCTCMNSDPCEPGVGNSCAACLEACLIAEYEFIDAENAPKNTFVLICNNP